MSSQNSSHSQPVHISRIRKSFGAFNAIRDFTLDVAAGEFVTFLGPSGCGKSTTLKILSGLMPQDSGEIRFGDKRIDMLPANKRNIGLVFQNYALFPHMTVAENIAFGLRMRGWCNADKKSARRRAPCPRAPRRSCRPPSGPAERRPAAARCRRPRARLQARSRSARRAALQPRCQAARTGSDRPSRYPAQGRADDGLRDA